MNKSEIFKLYEKHYFHEIDYRHKLIARLQLPLVVFVSFISLLSYMWKHIDFSYFSTTFVMFLFFLILSSELMLLGIVSLIKSFYGNKYEYIPTTNTIDKYREDLDSFYEEYEDGVEIASNYFEKFLYQYYKECASKNAITNEERSQSLHNSNGFMILMLAVYFVAIIIFHLGKLDKDNIDKNSKINVKEPLKIEIVNTNQ